MHFIRPREEWLDPHGTPWEGFPDKDGQPYKAPPFRGWDAIDTVVIHYPGADWADMDFDNDGDVDLSDDVTQIRSQHTFYATSRKYSLGYCYLIGQGGAIWESRGIRNANAANLGDRAHGTNPPPWNNRTISIQLIVDNQDPANSLQVAAVNWLLDHLVELRGRPMFLSYHQQGQATGCPGVGNIDLIETGVIGFGKSEPLEPEDDMEYRYKDDRYSNEWHMPFGTTYGGSDVASELAPLRLRHGTHDQMLAGLCWTAWGVDVGTAVARGLLV